MHTRRVGLTLIHTRMDTGIGSMTENAGPMTETDSTIMGDVAEVGVRQLMNVGLSSLSTFTEPDDVGCHSWQKAPTIDVSL